MTGNREIIWDQGIPQITSYREAPFLSYIRKTLLVVNIMVACLTAITTLPLVQWLESQKLSFLHYLGVRVLAMFRFHQSHELVQNVDLKQCDTGIEKGCGKPPFADGDYGIILEQVLQQWMIAFLVMSR